MRLFRIGFGVLFAALGVLMLVVVLRQGGPQADQAVIGPLALIGAGALSISSARKRKP